MKRYIPERNDIVWLDFDPSKGKEMGKYRPALVLSNQAYNKATGLFICCPISTSIRHAPTEVAINNLNKPSVVATNLITTLDWRMRKVKKVIAAEVGVFEDVILRILPIIGASQVLDALYNN